VNDVVAWVRDCSLTISPGLVPPAARAVPARTNASLNCLVKWTPTTLYGSGHGLFIVDLLADGGLWAQKTVFSVRPRDVHFHIMKKDKDADFWPRLLKDKTLEKTNVKLDWDRYVDEDEGDSAFDMGAMGPGAMVRHSFMQCNSVVVFTRNLLVGRAELR
jgi:hypothetical protein